MTRPSRPDEPFDIAHDDRHLSAHLRDCLAILRNAAPHGSPAVNLIDDAVAGHRGLRDVARHPAVVALLDAQRAPTLDDDPPTVPISLRTARSRPGSNGPVFNVDHEDYGGQDGYTFLRRARD